MSKVNCPCGNEISNVCSPSINNGWLLSDLDLEKMEETIESIDIVTVARDVWECHECGSIAIGNNTDNTIKWYSPKDGVKGELFLNHAGS